MAKVKLGQPKKRDAPEVFKSLVKKNLDKENYTIEELATKIHIPTSTFYRKLKEKKFSLEETANIINSLKFTEWDLKELMEAIGGMKL